MRKTMRLKAIAFDWGHTIMDERRDLDLPVETRPIHLMPGVVETLEQLDLPLALWANTRVAVEADARRWLERAGIGRLFQWVTTSVDAGARKPAPEFFQFALARCALERHEVLFVGNQRNADVVGGESFGIRTVWLSGADYRSEDDRPVDCTPSYAIATLRELPSLLQELRHPEPERTDDRATRAAPVRSAR
ncbi:MAG TPA: HAD family hydrolase [Vicinamibacterales bacterium]|nr:HAD family hydrolase [Vicinamibacterales bacterium]